MILIQTNYYVSIIEHEKQPMNSLGVIVGRGHSKRLPGKMLRHVGGHPLIGWAARAVAASNLTKSIVSTDDLNIAKAANEYGIETPFQRPSHLCSDNITNDSVIDHALRWMQENLKIQFDVVVLIQPTVPFIHPEDIDACASNVINKSSGCCFTAREVSTLPEGMFRYGADGMVDPVIPGPWRDKNRRDVPIPLTFQPNGAVWAMPAQTFLDNGTVYTSPLSIVEIEKSRCIDIDYEHDLAVAETMATQHGFTITPPSLKTKHY